MFYCLFLYGLIDQILKNIPVRNVKGSGGYVRNGGLVIASMHVCTMEGGSQIFAMLVRTY